MSITVVVGPEGTVQDACSAVLSFSLTFCSSRENCYLEIKTWPILPSAIHMAATADTRLIPAKATRVASLFCLPNDILKVGTKCSRTT